MAETHVVLKCSKVSSTPSYVTVAELHVVLKCRKVSGTPYYVTDKLSTGIYPTKKLPFMEHFSYFKGPSLAEL